MPDNNKTQEQLAQEIESLRSQLTDLRLEHIKRKQAEEELWESERRFLRLLDGLPLAVFVLDAEGKPYYQNKASRELFGKDIGPEAGGHLQEAFQAYLAGTDQVYPTERSPIHRALAGESSTVEDMEIRRPDKTIPVEAYGSPIYNLQGGIKYAVGVFHDIFERLRAEEALRRSEAFTRAVITHSPVGITVRNREGTLVLYNEAWKKTWTLTDEKVKENERISAGWSFEERYPHLKGYAPNAQQLFQEGGELFIPEVETGSIDPGVAQWVSLHFYALKNAEGQVEQIVTLTEDITARKHTQEALRENEERLKEAQAMGQIGNWEFDLASQAITWSDQTFALYERDLKLGAPTPEEEALYYPPEQSPIMREYVARAVETGESFQYDLQANLPSGRAAFFTATLRPVKDQNGRVVKLFGTVQDITARKTIEESLRQSEERYRSLMDNLNVGVYRNTPGPKGKFIEANPALVKMFGYTAKEELFEINVSDLYEHPEDRTQINEKLLRDGYVRNEVLRLKKTEGTPLWGSVTAVAVRDEVGTVIYYDGIIEDVTERKRAEEALRESEERYRAVMEQTAEGIVLYDVESKRVLAANPAYCKLLGYSPKEMLQLRIYDIVAAEPEAIDHTFQRIRQQKQAVIAQRKHRAKDGTLIDVEVRANLITFGTKEALCVVVRNISDRLQAELALGESEERFRTLVENVNIGIYRNTGGPQGKFVQVNPAMVKMFGCSSAEELMARPVAECYQNPEEREEFIAKVKRQGFARDEELRLRKKDGSPFWASVTAQAQFDARGEVLWTDGVIEDITERKRAEEALRESEEKFRLAFENAQDAIFWADPETGLVTKCNKAATDLLEKTREEIEGRNQMTLHPPQKADGYAKMFKKHIEHNGWVDDEAEVITKSGKIIPVHITASITALGGKPILQGIFRDITLRKRAEEALRESERKYRYLYDESPALSLMIGLDGTIKEANQTTLNLLGYAKESVLGRPALEFVAPEQHEKAAAQLERDFKGEPTPAIELDILARDGSRRTILFSPGQLVLYEEDRPTSILISGTDITERKRAEEALQKTHKDLEARVQEKTAELQAATRTLEARNQQLSRILDTGGSMLVSLDLDALLNEIAKAARETLGFEIVVLNLIDEKTREARFAAQAGLGEEARKALEGATVRMKWDDLKSLFQERFRVSRSCYFIPHGTVDWRTHAPTTGPIAQKVAVSDPLDKDPWHPEDALLALVELREKTVAGMFSLDSPRTGKRPSQETLLLLDVFTNLAAVAIDNARLYEQLQRELGERKQAQEALRQAHGELERRVEERTGELRDTLGKLRRTTETSIQAMALIVEMKDPYTAGHQRNVANLATAIAQELNLDAERTEGLRIAAMIHDVGKIGIPTEILTRPGPLSELEHHLIRDHPQLSSDILKTIDFSWPVAEIVRQHHEKMDGSGYPRGLKGDEILMEARILVVADVLESLAFHRPYRPGHGIEKALEELSSQRGKLYDGAVVDACLRLFKEKSFNFA